MLWEIFERASVTVHLVVEALQSVRGVSPSLKNLDIKNIRHSSNVTVIG